MLEKDVKDYDEMNEFLRVEKELFFTNLIICIQTAWESGEGIAPIAKFNITEAGMIKHISINSDDWYESLHLALYHFEEIENYEYCKEINTLIAKMYGE